jgi:hypothetical protein
MDTQRELELLRKLEAAVCEAHMWKERFKHEEEIVDAIWKACGIGTMGEAQGKTLVQWVEMLKERSDLLTKGVN